MKTLKKFFLAASFSLLAAGLSATAHAQEVWKLGTAAQPGTVLYDIVMKFINDFNAAAGPELKMEYQLVGNEQEMHQQVVRGRLQAGASSFAGGAIVVPEGAVFQTPYLWRNNEERMWVIDNFGVPIAKRLFAEKGLELIMVADVGWNDVICKTACLTPESIKGQKMRVSPSQASRITFKQLGANGVQMPLTEAWPGLQSGLVVGADLPFLFYVTTPAAQSAPHYVLTRHYHHDSTFIVNKALFDGMKPDLRAKMLKALPDVAWARKQVLDTEGPKMKEFVAKGGFVHQLTDAQREAWAAVIRPGEAEMVEAIGGKAQEVMDALKKGKAAFAARK
jgi:TRAP-type C4-dicarboxylate transport system substrate-binding protein